MVTSEFPTSISFNDMKFISVRSTFAVVEENWEQKLDAMFDDVSAEISEWIGCTTMANNTENVCV